MDRVLWSFFRAWIGHRRKLERLLCQPLPCPVALPTAHTAERPQHTPPALQILPSRQWDRSLVMQEADQKPAQEVCCVLLPSAVWAKCEQARGRETWPSVYGLFSQGKPLGALQRWLLICYQTKQFSCAECYFPKNLLIGFLRHNVWDVRTSWLIPSVSCVWRFVTLASGHETTLH